MVDDGGWIPKPLDVTISVKNLISSAKVGVKPPERSEAQAVAVTATLVAGYETVGRLGPHTYPGVCYAQVVKVIHEMLANDEYVSLEAICLELARVFFIDFTELRLVTIALAKQAIGKKYACDEISVSMAFTKADYEKHLIK